jgi:hypothetical protein
MRELRASAITCGCQSHGKASVAVPGSDVGSQLTPLCQDAGEAG